MKIHKHSSPSIRVYKTALLPKTSAKNQKVLILSLFPNVNLDFKCFDEEILSNDHKEVEECSTEKLEHDILKDQVTSKLYLDKFVSYFSTLISKY